MTKTKVNFDHLNDAIGDGSGFEDINTETMAIPFIKLVQALSPQMKKSAPEYNPDAKIGDVINSVTGKIYEEPLKIVVGKFDRLFLEWDSNTRGKLKGVHSPESIDLRNDLVRDDKNQFIDPDNSSTYQETYSYYVILPDHMEDGICMLSLSSSAIKAGKKLNRMLSSTMIPGSTQRAMPYFMVFDAHVVELSNDKGSWSSWDFKLDTFVNQEVLSCVTEERKALPERTVDYAQVSDAQLIEAPTEEHY